MNDLNKDKKVIDITASDVCRAGQVLANAFQDYPLFGYVFGNPSAYQRVAPWMFSSWVRWASLYAKAWVTADLNAVALRYPPGCRGMGVWETFRAGVWWPTMTMNPAAQMRLMRIASLISLHREAIMGDQLHWYCWTMAVEPALQRQGVGRPLMRHTFEQADNAGLPCYLETFSEKTVRVHESQSYVVKETVQVPNSSLKMYAMLRSARPR